jgi:hypothetical protein
MFQQRKSQPLTLESLDARLRVLERKRYVLVSPRRNMTETPAPGAGLEAALARLGQAIAREQRETACRTEEAAAD